MDPQQATPPAQQATPATPSLPDGYTNEPLPEGATVGQPAPSSSALPPGYTNDPLPEGATLGGSPQQGGDSSNPLQINDTDSTGSKIVKGVNDIGAGVGEGVLSTLNGAADIVHAPHATLAARQQELEKNNAENPYLRGVGYGGETLMEFLMGDEAIKGLSLADKLAKSANIAKALESSPRLMKALQMGADIGKAQTELSPEEAALVKAHPVVARLIGAGMDALRGGTVQGLQTTDRTGGDVKEGAKEGAAMAATAGVLGGATGAVGGALKGAGDTAAKVRNLTEVAASSPDKEAAANIIASKIADAKTAVHANYEFGINDLEDRLGDTTISAQDNPIANKAKKLLSDPVPDEHPLVSQVKDASGDRLDPKVRELLESLSTGTTPATDEEVEAAKDATKEAADAAKKAPKLVDQNGKPLSSTEAPEPIEAQPHPAPPMTVHDLVQLRQTVRQLADSYDYGDINARALKRLMWDPITHASPIDDTIGQLAKQSSDTKAVSDYQALRDNYRSRINLFDDPVIDKLSKGKYDDAAKAFVGLNRDGSALPTAGQTRLNTQTLRGIIGDNEVKKFGKNVFGNMLQDSTSNGTFDPGKFMKSWNRINDETKADLFDTGAAQSGLKQLAQDAGSAHKLQMLTKLGVIAPVAAGAAGAFHLGGMATGLGTLLGLSVMERGGSKAVGKDLLDYLANNPKVWKTYENLGRAANSKAAGIASDVTKGAAGETVAGAIRPDAPQEPGMVEPGNIDLYARPKVQNPDGSSSTVRSIGIEEDGGKHVLIPTVSNGADGKPPHVMTNKEAIDYYHKTGEHLGKFKSDSAADKYGSKLHEQYANGTFDRRPDVSTGGTQGNEGTPPPDKPGMTPLGSSTLRNVYASAASSLGG